MTSLLKKRNESETNLTPSRSVLSPFDEMERIFENFSTKGWLRPFHWDTPLLGDIASPLERKIPSIDVLDRDDEIIVKAELPGVEKKDLDISLTNNSVTIKSSTSHEEKEEKGDYYRCEITKGAYMRTVALPSEVDDAKAKASFKDGMLEITMPKVEKSHRRSLKVD